MCSDPITHNGHTFACRNCDQCIGARKNDWVARAMAERATSQHAYAFNLTYRDKHDGEKPDGARAFKYRDIQLWLKNLRFLYEREYGVTGEISYIICGELGENKGRVHWHTIVFAKRAFAHLGEWSDFYHVTHAKRGRENGPRITPMGRRHAFMDHWSIWPHGHIVTHAPDQAGISYVLKYALKTQFGSGRSKGKARAEHAEAYAHGVFRMSKKPPIGLRYLEEKAQRLKDLRAVPPKLELTIPGYSGFWWPKGAIRRQWCLMLHDVNQYVRQETGRDAPQWSTLLSTLEQIENVTDYEDLIYGPEERQEAQAFDLQQWRTHLATSHGENNKRVQAARIRATCGGPRPCARCFRGKTKAQKIAARLSEAVLKQRHKESGSPADFDAWARLAKQCNHHCELKDTPQHKAIFGA
ncbi:hypothetical protein AIOL_002210 [Candidatus Rhodobacter oscarellae]|uniref:Replication-associated protein ORF2/G2P domain-containing protein n=2 Tax=Candidatus Rhodobacter oscarellae TaxID=1675527 RepID=A0A0J9E607_9RHOB|nr:hypothetical protein AIOL_002210 [Candidatus Rhodobacter lobularis]